VGQKWNGKEEMKERKETKGRLCRWRKLTEHTCTHLRACVFM